MRVRTLEVDFRIPGSRSLKEKRGRLARLTRHLTKKHPVVVAEVGDQNIWARTGLAAVTISPDPNLAFKVLEAAARTVAEDRDLELVWFEIERR